MRNDIRQAQIDLAAAFRLAVRHGLSEGISNHFSLMLPGSEELFLINPFGLHWAEIRASDLLLLDRAGRTVEGGGEVEATAFNIHVEIHRAHPHARCVLHTHMPYATALTMIEGGRLEPAHQTTLRFHGAVAYDDTYNGLATEAAEGARMARLLDGKEVLFLANHGVIVTGATVGVAFDSLYYLERAAQSQCIALATGKPLRLVSQEISRKTRAEYAEFTATHAERHFEALKRLLDRNEPDYAD
ncbi:MAG TPA: aldolase [Alphaproteobacteria bacterium]|nr:aldolase [Alphaproteobacteria bacterium]